MSFFRTSDALRAWGFELRYALGALLTTLNRSHTSYNSFTGFNKTSGKGTITRAEGYKGKEMPSKVLKLVLETIHTTSLRSMSMTIFCSSFKGFTSNKLRDFIIVFFLRCLCTSRWLLLLKLLCKLP